MSDARDLPGLGDVIRCACGCGAALKQFDSWGRERRYLDGHNIRAMWNAAREASAR